MSSNVWFDDQVAVITGGGLGLQSALLLAALFATFMADQPG